MNLSTVFFGRSETYFHLNVLISIFVKWDKLSSESDDSRKAVYESRRILSTENMRIQLSSSYVTNMQIVKTALAINKHRCPLILDVLGVKKFPLVTV